MMIVGLFANPILVFKMGNDTAWDLERVIIIFFIWIRSGNQERLLLEEKKIDLEESEDVIFFAESKIKLTKTQQRAHLERKDYQKVLSTITACDDTSIWWIIGLDIDCLRAYSFFNISQWWAKNQKRCTYNITLNNFEVWAWSKIPQ